MAVKTTMETGRKPSPDFPKLMSSATGTIVLFSRDGTGVVVRANTNNTLPVGSYSDMWSMNQFSDFYGKVTLEND